MTASPAPARVPVALILALLLPILALVLMAVRSERIVQSGTRWQVRITGYDPRDLVSGHYLRYRIAWDFAPDGSLGEPECSEGACSLCLNRRAGDSARVPEPQVRRVTRGDTGGCDSSFPVEAEEQLHRYFIPEGMGDLFEAALRDRERQVRLELSISRAGKVVITELLIDGMPWRSVLKK